MKAKTYIPPFRFAFLTFFYDFLCEIFGFGNTFRQSIIDSINVKRPLRVLDVGCGTGTMSLFLAEKYPKAKITGLDPDSPALKLAQKRAVKKGLNIDFRKGYASKLPFKPNSMDLVESTLVIHHIPSEDKEKSIQELFRVLKHGGYLILADFGKPKTSLGRFFGKIILSLEHGKENYEGKIPRIVKAAGFKILKRQRLSWAVDLIVAKK